MMDEKIKNALAEKELPEWHGTFLNGTRDLVDMSRRAMGQYYEKWDRNNEVYRGWRQADESDKKAKERGEPEKMVVPITYSQAQTFAAFCFALFTQREHVFELTGVNPQSHRAAKIGEALLQRDLTYNLFEAKLYQLLIDIARFSIGVFKTSWCHKTQLVKEEVPLGPVQTFFGKMLGRPATQTVETEQTKYLGNEISSISPYRFYPDTRLPLTRFQEGEFCASEDQYSYAQLKELETQGLVAGIDHVSTMTKNRIDQRGGVRMAGIQSDQMDNLMVSSQRAQKAPIVITEVQRVIADPSKFDLGNEKMLDPKKKRPTKYLVWYANDSRIVRFEPLNYVHDEFCYDVAFFSPDQNELCSLGLADTIDQLQSVLTWFINARITSVRKVIQNYLVVDPEGIEIKDLQNRNPIIRLKPGMGNRGIDRWIKQLAVNDVTTNHLADAKFLQELVSLTTGINENLLGQFHSGRRSAREAGNVMSSAANRLKMIATLVFRMCLEAMARKMISNLRDGLDEETMVKVVGLQSVQEGFIPVSKKDLVGTYDFDVFDGTLPSEKGMTADVFAQIVEAFMKSPEAAIAIGIDPRACFIELMELRGVRNPERFMLPLPPPAQPQSGGAPPMGGQEPPMPEPVANGMPSGERFPMLGEQNGATRY